MQLSDRQKRILRWVGYPLLAFFTFIMAAHLTFPYERVKDRLVDVLSQKYEVTVVSVGRTLLPGGLILDGVTLRTRPTLPDEKPTEVHFDSIRVDMGLLALLRGRADVDIEALTGGGSIDGNVQVSSAEVMVSFSTSGLPLESLPGLRDAVGLPVKGALDTTIDVTLPEGHWDKANGEIVLACSGCSVGDGKSKIKPRPRPGARQPTLKDGVTVPELNLGAMSSRIVISGGKGTVEQFVAKSVDGELGLQATIRFGREFKDSRFESGCMRFKLSDELRKRDPNFGNMQMIVGLNETDGFSNVKLKGTLSEMRWLPARTCDVGDDDGRPSSTTIRPSISSTERVVPKPVESAGTNEDMEQPPGAMPPTTEPPLLRDEDRAFMETRDVEDVETGTDMPPPPPIPPPRMEAGRVDDVSPPDRPMGTGEPMQPEMAEPEGGERDEPRMDDDNSRNDRGVDDSQDSDSDSEGDGDGEGER